MPTGAMRRWPSSRAATRRRAASCRSRTSQLGKKLAAKIEDNAQWREERPGQEEVAVGDLVEAVNRLLGRGERRP